MKIEITEKEAAAIQRAEHWLKLLCDRDCDDDAGDAHEGMREDRQALLRVCRKLERQMLDT